jgi:predicted ATPase
LKYIIYLDYQRLRAKIDEDKQRLQKWFDRFETALKDIYNCPELHLEPIPDDLVFKVNMPNIEPFGLNEMADGYSAFLDIIIELMLRMDDGNAIVNTDLPGIVLIDEIETHLHIELQKKIMPFLIKMFPNVQFIVSTHSPFVISSINNAVVFDLENKRRVEDLSAYSWETIVESYFDVNQYSHQIENKFNRYKELCLKVNRERTEEKEFSKLRAELSLVPPAQKELYNAFQQLELQRKAGK